MLKMGCNPAASKMASNIKMNQMFDIWNWVPERIFVPQCSILLKNQVSYCIVWFSGKKASVGLRHSDSPEGREHRRGDKSQNLSWPIASSTRMASGMTTGTKLVSSWHGKSWKVRMPLKITRGATTITGYYQVSLILLALRSLQLESSSANWKKDEKGRMQLEVNEELMASCSCGDDVPLALINEYTTSLMHCGLPGNFTSIQVEVWRGMGHILSCFPSHHLPHQDSYVSYGQLVRFGKPPYAALYIAMIIDPWPWWQQNQVVLSSLICLLSLLNIIELYDSVGSLKFWSVALYDLSIMNYLCGRPRTIEASSGVHYRLWHGVSPSPEWKSVEPQESGKSNQKDLAGVKTSLESSWIYSNPMHSMHINARYCKCQVIATDSALLLCLDSADFTRSAKTESISFLGSTLHRLQNLLRSTPWPHRKSQEHFRQTVKRRLLSGNAKENPQILDDSCQLFFIFSFSRFSILAFALTKPSTLAGSKNESTLCRLNCESWAQCFRVSWRLFLQNPSVSRKRQSG